MRLKSMVASAAALAFAAGLAHADQAQAASPQDALQAMRELNIIVLGDMDANHSIEGKVFVGGNLTGQNGVLATGNSAQGLAASTRPTLTVVGDVTVSNLQIQAGSNGGAGPIDPAGVTVGGSLSTLNLNAQNATVQVGGTISNTNGSNGSTIQAGGASSGYLNANGATVQTGLGSAFTDALTSDLDAQALKLGQDLNALSAALSVLTVDTFSTVTMGGQGPTFNAVDGGSGFALFNIDAALLASPEINFNVTGAPMPIIVNVTGGNNIAWNANAVGGFNDDLNPWIIWNFVNTDPDADPINIFINREMHGSILAPNAIVTNDGGRIEGTLVALTFNQKAQVHLGAFAGDDFLPGVPEPSTWAMMILGFGAAGAALRRRRALVAA